MTRRAMRAVELLLTAIVSGTIVPDADAQADEKLAMARARLTTEAGFIDGGTRVGSARDDSIRDLRRKIVKLSGNTALLSFGGSENLAVVFAEVFRCAAPPAAAPGTAPARLPLPPPPAPAR